MKNIKVDRSAFLYLEPEENSFGSETEFAQCSTCRMWTGEDTKRCTILGKDFEVLGTDTCGLYVNGENNTSGSILSSVIPKDAGFERREVRCENCNYYRPTDSVCKLFSRLNFIPGFEFDDAKVSPYGCCNANVPITDKLSFRELFKK